MRIRKALVYMALVGAALYGYKRIGDNIRAGYSLDSVEQVVQDESIHGLKLTMRNKLEYLVTFDKPVQLGMNPHDLKYSVVEGKGLKLDIPAQSVAKK